MFERLTTCKASLITTRYNSSNFVVCCIHNFQSSRLIVELVSVFVLIYNHVFHFPWAFNDSSFRITMPLGSLYFSIQAKISLKLDSSSTVKTAVSIDRSSGET